MIPLANKDEVVVVDVKMPFWSMVAFLVKLSFAAIPAIIIIALVYALIGGGVMSALSGIR